MSAEPLSVAVTGPTGEIGKAFIRALEKADGVGAVRGMARSEFNGAEFGWERAEYVRGDILDPGAVGEFVAGADVVVHLAFIIFGDREETRSNNLKGSRNVFEATARAGAKRLVYTSSVAAYGFHSDNPQPLTETIEPRGSEGFYYSAQKAELERTMTEAMAGRRDRGRTCSALRSSAARSRRPWSRTCPTCRPRPALPSRLRQVLGVVPTPAPILPDFGVPLQLVHADDVADALVAAVLGKGEPGIYNLAASGEITIADVAREMGWRSVSMPKAAIDVTSELLDRLPLTPARAEWLHALRTPVVMDASRARTALGWKPHHDAIETLRETVAGATAVR